jgi:hypothetical protein
VTAVAAAPLLAGAGLALSAGAIGAVTGLDRERSFYATMLMVVASYYCLFAVLGGGLSVLLWESAGLILFVAVAIGGFRSSMWIVVVALASHGLIDMIHGHVLDNAGVPSWWPAFCASFDITAAACLAVRINRAPNPLPFEAQAL